MHKNLDISTTDHNLPPSLYLTSKPAWYGPITWPSIGPEITGGIGARGHAYSTPAMTCYTNTPKDANGLLNFNAKNCYLNNSTGIKSDNSIDNTIFIYPNPTSGKIYFKNIYPENSRMDVKIFSIDGVLLMSKITSVEKESSIDVSDLASGIYFVQFKNNNNEFVSRKISVIHN